MTRTMIPRIRKNTFTTPATKLRNPLVPPDESGDCTASWLIFCPHPFFITPS